MTGLRALGGALVALVGVRSAAGAVILVPADVATIQGAIQWASSGDTILVAPGTYREQIDFLGKNVSVTAVRGPEATTIDAQGAGSVVTFAGGEGPDAILAGFTITGGHASEGGGILVLSSNPTIQDCIVTGNTCIGPNGGSAFFAGTTAAVMTCCTVSGNTNTTGADGAGVHATTGSTVVITGCQFIGNTATDGPYGRAIRLAGQSILRDCVISGNSPRGAYIHGDALVENAERLSVVA